MTSLDYQTKEDNDYSIHEAIKSCPLQLDMPTYVQGFTDGYNKANEWHNLVENPDDLPNDGEFVLANNLLTTAYVKFKKEKDGNYWKHDYFEICNVRYWKRLVLPIKEID